KTTTNAAAWTISGTTAKYKSESSTAGYTLSSDGKSITYSAAKNATDLITISGLKNNAPASGISLNGNTVTLNANTLGTSKVSISGNYKLALASNVTKPTTKAAAWTISGTTAKYKSESSTAGYTLSSDAKSITYSTAKNASDLITISGLKNNAPASGISLNGNTVTLNANTLGTSKVSISGNYKLALASNVDKPKTTSAWSVSGTTATYNIASKTAGYTLASDGKSINYSAAVKGTAAVSISGLKSNLKATNGNISGISINNKNITLNSSVLNANGVATINGSGYTFNLTGSGKLFNINSNTTLVGSGTLDSLSNYAQKVLINAGDGNDKINNIGKYVTIQGGVGNDSINNSSDYVTITGGKGNDTISFTTSNVANNVINYANGD
ncbi:MAG: hypothetical protein IJ728_12310, partial [Selenomonadaceae bacterium]|nr:hypothetical protein [Selenomonadaceae bacterium]